MKSRTTLILVLLAVVAGGLVWLDARKGLTTEDATAKRRRLVDLRSDEVTRVELIHSNQTVVVEKAGEQWNIKAPLAVRASTGSVNAILDELEFTERERTLTEKELAGTKLAEFGLDTPRVRATVTGKKGAVTVLVGGETPTKDGLYVQVAGSKSVSVVRKELFDRLNVQLDDLRDRQLVDFPTENASRLEIKSPQRAIELTRNVAKTNAASRWVISRPLAIRADQTGASELLNALSGLRVSDFVSEDPKDIHAYGLDEPAHEVTVWTAGNDAGTSLLLGRALTNDAEKVYAKLKGSDSIVTVPAAEARKFDAQVNDLRDHRLFAVNAGDVQGIDIQRGAETISLARDGDAWNVLTGAGANEFRADDVIMPSLLSQLVNVVAKEFTVDVATDLDKFGLVAPPVSVTLRGAGTNVVARLLLGAENATAGIRYAKRADEAFVYGLDTNALRLLPSRPLDLRDRSIADLKADDITQVTIRRAADAVTLDRAADKTWRLTVPAQGVLDSDALRQLLEALAGLRAEEFERTGLEGLAEYGLDAPEVSVTARAGEKTWTLAIGKDAPAGMKYASWNEPPLVFTLPVSAVAVFTAPLVTLPVTTNPTPAEVTK